MVWKLIIDSGLESGVANDDLIDFKSKSGEAAVLNDPKLATPCVSPLIEAAKYAMLGSRFTCSFPSVTYDQIMIKLPLLLGSPRTEKPLERIASLRLLWKNISWWKIHRFQEKRQWHPPGW